MPASPKEASSRRLRTILAIWLVLYYLTAAIGSASLKSATCDETAHLGAGISYWKTLDFRMNPEHPPLVKWLSAGLALATMPVHFEVSRPAPGGAAGGKPIVLAAWEDGDQYSFGNYLLYRQNDADAVLFRARLAPILIGLLGGLVAAGWARELARGKAGRTSRSASCASANIAWSGLAAAWLLLLYPEYMGHARWVTFDVPAAVACGACSLLLWRWWRRPTLARAAAFVAAVTLGTQVKFTVQLFVAIQGIGALGAALFSAWSTRRADRKRNAAGCREFRFLWRRGVGATAALFAAAAAAFFLASWALCGFRFVLTAPGQPPLVRPNPFMNFQSASSISTQTAPLLFRALGAMWRAHLLPEATLASLNVSGSLGARPTFLRGKTSRIGFIDFFFWTILLKTPLVYLALGLWIFGAWVIARRPGCDDSAPFSTSSSSFAPDFCVGKLSFYQTCRAGIFWFFAFPYLALFALSVMSRVSLGHRHILFLYVPFCAVAGAAIGRWLGSLLPKVRELREQGLEPRREAARWLAAQWTGTLILLAALGVNLAAFPNYSTYFNWLAGGGARSGSRFLLDSNADWGEDLKPLGRFASAHGIKAMNLAVFTSADPVYYGIARFRQILPSYQYAVNMPASEPPDPVLPTAVSLNNLDSVRALYPGLIDAPPMAVLNSILVFPPANEKK